MQARHANRPTREGGCTLAGNLYDDESAADAGPGEHTRRAEALLVIGLVDSNERR